MKRLSGFSLIEVLVAMFVFATGILGLASLQFKSLTMLSNSISTNYAMYAASDMVDRMHANQTGVFGGVYDSLSADSDSIPEDPECGTSCTQSELAQFDLFHVYSQLDRELPDAAITVTNTGNNVFSVDVTWTERMGQVIETKRHRLSFLPYKP